MEQPIDMICVCASDGSMTPLRFRVIRNDLPAQTAAVTQVVSCKPVRYVGIECVEYLCMARLGEREYPYYLRFDVRSHSWFLVEKSPTKRSY